MYIPRRTDPCWHVARFQNFTLPLEGATTAEAIAEKRAAEFEAAEAVRLKVLRDALTAGSIVLGNGLAIAPADVV